MTCHLASRRQTKSVSESQRRQRPLAPPCSCNRCLLSLKTCGRGNVSDAACMQIQANAMTKLEGSATTHYNLGPRPCQLAARRRYQSCDVDGGVEACPLSRCHFAWHSLMSHSSGLKFKLALAQRVVVSQIIKDGFALSSRGAVHWVRYLVTVTRQRPVAFVARQATSSC